MNARHLSFIEARRRTICVRPPYSSIMRRPTWQLCNYRSMPEGRRFPPPWSVEETDACFIIRDTNGQAQPQRHS
jgi:hypothetical protein